MSSVVPTPTDENVPWVNGLPGVQFHHRSVLTWPELLTEAGRDFARLLLHSGARVLSLGEPFAVELADDVTCVPLTVWTGPSEASATAARIGIGVPDIAEWAQMVSLWRDMELTPLASSARDHPEWVHSRRHDASGTVIATASAQILAAAISDTDVRRLVCSVACNWTHQRSGNTRACVRAATDRSSAAALVEPDSASGAFFSRLGWSPRATAHLYTYS